MSQGRQLEGLPAEDAPREQWAWPAPGVVVYGYVKSDSAGERLKDVHVYAFGMAYGRATDSEGRYEFKYPPGRYMIRAERVGFRSDSILVSLDSTAVRLDFSLRTLVLCPPGDCVFPGRGLTNCC